MRNRIITVRNVITWKYLMVICGLCLVSDPENPAATTFLSA